MLNNMKLFINMSMVVYCLLTVFNISSAVGSVIKPVSTEDDDMTTTKMVEGDTETQMIDEQAINRYGGRADGEFKLRDLFPTRFGEFFEIFVFFMELKWHYEIEDAIAAAGERINEHLISSNGAGAQHKDDNYLLDFAKHYFVNNKTPLWKFKA